MACPTYNIDMPTDDYGIVKRFSRRLRELRITKKLTQEKLAELADISYKNVQYLESKNPTCPSLITLNKLAKAFNMSISRLVSFN
jgi:transcriptional regulator with XRE-family HTH domain